MITHIERGDVEPNFDTDPTVHVMHCGVRLLEFKLLDEQGNHVMLPEGHDFFLEGRGDEGADCVVCIALKGQLDIDARELEPA